MITSELSQYVKDQLAAGILPGDIRTALINKGWPVIDVDKVLGENVAVSIDNNRVMVSPGAIASTKGKGLLIVMSVLLLLILFCGGVYATYLYIKHSSSNSNLSNANSLQTNQGGSPTPAVEVPTTTTVFQDTGIKFSYDSSWKKIGGSTLITGNFDEPIPSNISETQYLFFNPDNWQTVVKEVSDFKTAPPSGGDAFGGAIKFIAEVGSQSDFSLTRMAKTNAHTAAQQSTQTVCSGSNIDFSTTNPIIESRVQPITVGKYAAYLLAPQNGCDYKSTQLFLDANTSIAMPTPVSVPGVTVTVTGGLSTSNDSFILGFNNAADLQHLSQSQQIILNSLQLP